MQQTEDLLCFLFQACCVHTEGPTAQSLHVGGYISTLVRATKEVSNLQEAYIRGLPQWHKQTNKQPALHFLI